MAKSELSEQNRLIDKWVAHRNAHIGDITIPQVGEYPPQVEAWYGSQENEYVNTDLIRHFADGMGDRNPLWRSQDYARRTRWGGIIAPPTFTDTIGQPYAGWEEPENPERKKIKFCVYIPNGSRREMFQVIRPGDKLRIVQVYLGMKEIESTRPEPAREFDEAILRRFINQREEVVATYERHMSILFNHDVAQKGPFFGIRKRRRLTDEERDGIERGYAEETRRGADTLYWEEVKVGEEIKLHPIGPQSPWDSVACLCVLNGHAVAYEVEWERINRFREFAFYNPDFNAWECGGIMHLVDSHPANMDYTGGPSCGFYSQIEWLLGRMICNWMGDDGFLKVLDDRVPLYPINGEVFCCKGKVTNRYTEGSEHLIDMEVRCENLDGEILVTGTATVRLPSRTDFGKV